MSVDWTRRAISERVAAIEWLAERNPTAAFALIADIDRVLSSLDAREFEGREVQLDGGRLARRWPVGTLVIYYRRKGDALLVLRVFDARREPIET